MQQDLQIKAIPAFVGLDNPHEKNGMKATLSAEEENSAPFCFQRERIPGQIRRNWSAYYFLKILFPINQSLVGIDHWS